MVADTATDTVNDATTDKATDNAVMETLIPLSDTKRRHYVNLYKLLERRWNNIFFYIYKNRPKPHFILVIFYCTIIFCNILLFDTCVLIVV